MSTYEGQSKDGMRQGFGSLLYDNGDRYIGEWRKGLMHGIGVYLSKSGDTYYGQYDNGKWNGFGFMELSNGERRFGEWQDNKFHGLNIGKTNDEFQIGRMENNFLNGKSAIFKSTRLSSMFAAKSVGKYTLSLKSAKIPLAISTV